jgi:hypothetical protein
MEMIGKARMHGTLRALPGGSVRITVLVSAALALALALCTVLGAASASAAVWTDQPGYSPGATVTISGDNSDGAGYQAGEEVDVTVAEPNEGTLACSATADESGAWSCQVTLAADDSAIGSYSYTATGGTSAVTQSGSFTDAGCPSGNSLGSHTNSDPKLGASYTTSGDEASYSISTTNENPVGGIPGLIEYCVYTEPLPGSNVATYSNLDGAWTPLKSEHTSTNGHFDFGRSGGNPDNLPFDGSEHEIGTASWSGSVPTEQTILLHINDQAECTAVEGTPTETCFVRPGKAQSNPAHPLTASVTADPALTRSYRWGIDKSVDASEVTSSDGSATLNYTVSVTHDGGTDSGWTVTGTVSVTNPNAAAVENVDVTDSINDANATCNVTGGSKATIPATTTAKFAYTCTYSAAPTSSSETDTATVAWPAQTLADKSVLAGGSLETSAAVEWPAATVTIVDGSVSLNDTLAGSLGTVSYTEASPKSFKYAHEFTGDAAGTCTTHKNTAAFTTDTTGSSGSASASVKVCVGADVKVSKTASPSFTRTYKWSIEKSVDKSEVTTNAGEAAKFNYTVALSHDSGTDSAWRVAGTITVANPNDWEAVSVTNVTDAIDNGGSCTVGGPEPDPTVPAGGSIEIAYTCTYASTPTSASFTNTATAVWDQAAASTPDGSASGKASGEFSNPTVVDGSASVADTLAGSLGTASYTEPSPIQFKYAHEFTGDPAGKCTTHENTAAFTTSTTGSKGSASRSVKVCVNEPPCTKIVGSGHFGAKSPLGDTVDDNLTINPGYTGKEEFNYSFEIAPGVKKGAVGLKHVIGMSCVKTPTEFVFKGHGLATLNGVKGYEVTFTFWQKEGNTYLLLVLEKGGAVVREWRDEPLLKVGLKKEVFS